MRFQYWQSLIGEYPIDEYSTKAEIWMGTVFVQTETVVDFLLALVLFMSFYI